MTRIVAVAKPAADLLVRLKGSSNGLLLSKCNGEHVAVLEGLGVVEVQEADHEIRFLARVIALPVAWEIEIRVE